MIAIIGDIIKSKALADRRKTQESLYGVLQQINQRYAEVLASKFTVTLGDEFQGVLTNAN
ncbi:MAG: hypothetical protein GX603_01905, partial [Chloroflexi bacterium]|nr:hypothetical protein [Chloroflexota bacterium]